MPSPIPKPEAERQRRNKSATRTVLSRDVNVKAPKLPDVKEWHPTTRAWWRDLWRSPMAPEFLQMDRYAVLRLAHLVDLAHWCPGDPKLEETIMRMEQRFGLTPLDRRRLDWRVEDEKKPTPERRPVSIVPDAEDPRNVLRAV